MPPSIRRPDSLAERMRSTLILPARDPNEGHRASTPLELLFEMVIVIAIPALAAAFHHVLADGHGADALPQFLLLFVTIWWAWMHNNGLGLCRKRGPSGPV